MAEKTSAVQSLACGLAQIALSSTHFVEENSTEPRNPKCRSATNSPQASPLVNHKLNALPKSASLDVLIPEDKSSASNGTHKVQPRRSHSYQPTGKGGYEDHKHKEVGISINVKLMLYTLVAELLLWGQTPAYLNRNITFSNSRVFMCSCAVEARMVSCLFCKDV